MSLFLTLLGVSLTLLILIMFRIDRPRSWSYMGSGMSLLVSALSKLTILFTEVLIIAKINQGDNATEWSSSAGSRTSGGIGHPSRAA